MKDLELWQTTAHLLGGAIRERVLEESVAFGLLARNLPTFDMKTLLSDLSTDLERDKFRLALVGFPESKSCPPQVATTVEQAVAWRNDVKVKVPIVVLLNSQSEPEKVHSLELFETFEDSDLRVFVCRQGQRESTDDKTITQMWQVLMCKDVTQKIPLVATQMANYYSVLRQGLHYGQALPYLGLLCDPSIEHYACKGNKELVRRLQQNSQQIQRLLTLNKSTFHALAGALANDESEYRSTFLAIQRYSRDPSVDALIALELDAVDALFQAKANIFDQGLISKDGSASAQHSKGDKQENLPLDEFLIDNWIYASGELAPDVHEVLREEIEWYQEDPSNDQPAQHDARDEDHVTIAIDGREVEVLRPVEKEDKHPLEDAMRLWVQTDCWGGIVTPSQSEGRNESLPQLLEDAVALVFEPFQPLGSSQDSSLTGDPSLLVLFEALEQVLDASSNEERLGDMLKKLYSQRSRLAEYRTLFLYSPQYAVMYPFTFSLIEEYIQTYESLAKRLKDIYPKAAEQYHETIEQVTAKFLALDVVIIDRPDNEAVCLTTLHPLHLWKWLELAHRIHTNKNPLTASEQQMLRHRVAQLPTLLNTFVLHPAMFFSHTRHINEPRLALAGEIHNLRLGSDIPSIGIPFYQAIARQSTTLDGFNDFEDLLKKFLALHPPARVGIVLCLINPPALEPVLRTCAGFHTLGLLSGARIQVYRTHIRSLVYDEWRVDDQEVLELFRDNSRFSLKIELRSGYAEIIQDLENQGRQHLVLLCDPSEAIVQPVLRILRERPDPFGIPLHVSYDQISDVVRLAPAPSGGIFDVYSSIRNALAGELHRRTLGVGSRLGTKEQELNAIANLAHWLVVIDRPHGLVETRIRHMRRLAWRSVGARTLAVYTSEQDYQECWIGHFAGYQFELEDIDRYLDEALAILPDGFLSTLGDPPLDESQANHVAIQPESVMILLGITATLRWYRRQRPSAVLLSVSHERFLDWFDVNGQTCKNNSKAYLLAIGLEDKRLYVDVVAVSAYDTPGGGFPSLPQSKPTLRCLDAFARTLQTLFESSANEALLAPIRRELLRESLITAIYAPVSQQSREIKAEWAQAINELFTGGSVISKVRDIRVVLDGKDKIETQAVDDAYCCPAEVVTLPVNTKHIDKRALSPASSGLGQKQALDQKAASDSSESVSKAADLRQADRIHSQVLAGRLSPEQPAKLGDGVTKEIEKQADQLRRVLMDYGVAVAGVETDRTQVGPRVVRYWVSLQPPAGRLSEVQKIAVDLARELGCKSVPLIDNILGERYVGIDLAREQPETVMLESALDELSADQPNQLLVAMGVDTAGSRQQVDLVKLPHMLVAGSTGSGKTVFLTSLITSLVWRHSVADLELILVDPKQTDFIIFDQLPHLRGQRVLYQADNAINTLHELAEHELVRRTQLLRAAGCPNNLEYNRRHPDSRLPWIVIIVDEFADIMMTLERGEREDFERQITRLAQIGRAKGIHLVLATQRPTTDIITGNIKANIPARVSFRLPSGIDSRTILDRTGAENLLGQGDMLVVIDGTVQRLQGYYASYSDLKRLLEQVIG